MSDIALSPFVTMVESEDGMVFLHEKTGRYWQLNGTGSEIVQLLLGGETAESTAALIREKYPEAAEQAAADVDALIHRLRDAKLLAR
ncbi:lasso peptide biosynthesis PqqD family chaperone [Streptomyces sp. NPDC006798]|uniref:lasso peptide biosynthesis PqqD family chaperone n=1 Tax=Streptomyces sp. NPDC006798 TaxID=3155462 RepID=UPI0033F0DAE4